MELFKERLQILLDEQNLNQKELAKMSGVTEVTISRYMNGFRKPRIEIANKIAQVLGTTTDYLLGNSDIRNPYKEDKEDQLPDGFDSPEEAIDFLLNQNVIMGFGGFDVEKLSDDEKVEFANSLLEHLKLLSLKYKK